MPVLELDALVFDVQGTLLDFFGPVSRALADLFGRDGIDGDAAAVTLAWRRSYMEATRAVAAGTRPFVPAAAIYRTGLDDVLAAAGLADRVAPAARDALTAAWSHLEPWPDTADALRRLRPHAVLATLTNGGLADAVATAARHDLAFHAILSTEFVRTFKPHPSTYRFAIEALALAPARTLMVASHPYDLEAAAAAGLRTAFIRRPAEFGPARENVPPPPAGTDLVATDALDLARQLGAA